MSKVSAYETQILSTILLWLFIFLTDIACLLYFILQLQDTCSEGEFHDLLSSEDYDFRYICGVSKPSFRTPFSEKEKVVSAMCLHYTILVSLAELEQLRRGLAVQNFNSLMDSYPALLRTAFEPPQHEISSSFIQDMFLAEFSPKGCNQREIEEAILMCWVQYLHHTECKYHDYV